MRNHGWIGNRGQVLNFLSIIGADSQDGQYIVGGKLFHFLNDVDAASTDADEMIVGHDAVYYIDGKPAPLAAGMRSTSGGVGVKVY